MIKCCTALTLYCKILMCMKVNWSLCINGHREDNVNRAHFPEETNPLFYVQTPAREIFLSSTHNVSLKSRCVAMLIFVLFF